MGTQQVNNEFAALMSRRMFITNLTIATVSAAVLSLPSVAARADGAVPAGPTSDFNTGDFRKVKLSTGTVAYLTKTADGYLALSAKCTHRGCTVKWNAAQNKFVCPCHHGTYDANGAVVSGPPPRPLVKLTTRVEHGMVMVDQ
ncbi:MAG: ubiquinol-cytochrome c reductase iron-sulfur subunit [Capsulimonadaceae bacterium]